MQLAQSEECIILHRLIRCWFRVARLTRLQVKLGMRYLNRQLNLEIVAWVYPICCKAPQMGETSYLESAP